MPPQLFILVMNYFGKKLSNFMFALSYEVELLTETKTSAKSKKVIRKLHHGKCNYFTENN